MRPLAAQRTNQCRPSLENPRTKILRRGLSLTLKTPALTKIMSHRSGMTDFLFLTYPMGHWISRMFRMPVLFAQSLSIQAISQTGEPSGSVKKQHRTKSPVSHTVTVHSRFLSTEIKNDATARIKCSHFTNKQCCEKQ